MDRKDNRQQFINFLKKQKCYEQYKINTSNFTNIFDFILKIDEDGWINDVFHNFLTPEGEEYWVRINEIWTSKFQ